MIQRGSLWQVFLSYLRFVLVSCIQWLWFVSQFKHFDNSTLISSAQEISNDSSSNPLSMKVSMLLKL